MGEFSIFLFKKNWRIVTTYQVNGANQKVRRLYILPPSHGNPCIRLPPTISRAFWNVNKILILCKKVAWDIIFKSCYFKLSIKRCLYAKKMTSVKGIKNEFSKKCKKCANTPVLTSPRSADQNWYARKFFRKIFSA